jgi:hypothetical protein
MPHDPQQLLEHALEMPLPERGRLAALQIESLDGATDEEAETAWSDEIAHRITMIDSGQAPLVPCSEVRRQMRIAGHDGG